MSLPVSVPYAFANATTTQNLSYLDSNFNAIANGLNGLSNGSSQISVSSIFATGTANSTTYLRGDGAWANISTGSTSSISNGTSNVSVDSANGPVSINTNGSNAMYIDASQNVGIGTASPASKLDLYNGGSQLKLGMTATGNGFAITNDPAYTLFQTANAVYMGFGTNGTERMRIDSSGNLLVGTTTVYNSSKVTVSNANGIGVVGWGAGIGTGISMQTAVTSSSDAIGFVVGSTYVGAIRTTSTGPSLYSISDYRYKQKATRMSGALDTVLQLNPVDYEWKIDGSKGQGFIAHELQQFIPVAVDGEKDAVNEDGSIKPQSVDYSKIVVHLVAALQETVAKIDDLSAEVTALKAKVGA